MKTDHPYSCTVLVLNYNGLAFLERFCASWLAHLPEYAQLVIADNASTDESLAYLAANHPNVGVISLKENHGFAKGYNLAMQEIDTTYCILLNSDVEIKSSWVEPLIDMMVADDTIAAVQPKILDQKKPSHFEYAGAAGGYIDHLAYPYCRGRVFQTVEEDLAQYETASQIFWASGAAITVRTAVFKEMGGFDADFFAHMEEIDLCWRFKRLGYKVMYQPASKIYHVGGGTLAYASTRKTFLNFRNSLLMILKNEEPGSVFSVIFQRMILDAFAAYSFLFKGQFGSFFAVFRAHMAFYGLFLKFRKKRKALSKLNTNKTSNTLGRSNKSIVFQHYLKGVQKFTEL